MLPPMIRARRPPSSRAAKFLRQGRQLRAILKSDRRPADAVVVGAETDGLYADASCYVFDVADNVYYSRVLVSAQEGRKEVDADHAPPLPDRSNLFVRQVPRVGT